ncbi:bile acid:sodium symporter [Aquitalea palustris]|uniref:Bile acid:sodium symporter n=1 Tax=Aquitalea palustris TaxID=2480983 RepID=A0A454JED7_9NEIS|nr:bile acid:sodium symporter family protein [Aquitalea palustris]RMC93285.1 bile acid:sodium symporter [Aquitalea palustris]
MLKMIDSFTLALIATVTLASLLPCQGEVAQAMNLITTLAIGLLFFLHGAKLSREAVIAGATHWKLHLTVMACTFALFPALGLALKPLLGPLVTPELYLGVLYLCMLPSTVQSSIAFTSMAQGNIPAAICSATASNIFGIFITPLLVGMLVISHHGSDQGMGSITDIVLQLLLPFIAGQIARRWIGGWVDKHKPLLRYVDQGSILLVVYTAFSAAVITGLWQQTPPQSLLGLLVVCGLLLAILLGLTAYSSRKLGFDKADQITIVFCGSKKSLASGVPMAKVLFAGHPIGSIVLPLMLFHQIQLMTCAVLAQRYRKQQLAAQLASQPV